MECCRLEEEEKNQRMSFRNSPREEKSREGYPSHSFGVDGEVKRGWSLLSLSLSVLSPLSLDTCATRECAVTRKWNA